MSLETPVLVSEFGVSKKWFISHQGPGDVSGLGKEAQKMGKRGR